jgi:hypothetical protein
MASEDTGFMKYPLCEILLEATKLADVPSDRRDDAVGGVRF